jgi:serpin B
MEKEAWRPRKKARGTSADSTSGLTALALRLADKFSNGEEHKGQNIMFSPLSVYTALGLLAAGAHGTTLDEVLAVLGAVSCDDRSPGSCEPWGRTPSPAPTTLQGH